MLRGSNKGLVLYKDNKGVFLFRMIHSLRLLVEDCPAHFSTSVYVLDSIIRYDFVNRYGIFVP